MLFWLLACKTPSPVPTDTAEPPTATDEPVDTDDTDVQVPYDPSATGPFQVEATFVETGPRPTWVYRPVGADQAPVVVLLHGFQLPPTAYTTTATHLASHGYLVLTPRMSGTLFSPTTHAALSVEIGGVLDWVDTAPTELGSIDPALLALAGHSLGGKIATLRATEDTRVDALFTIDPVDAAPPFVSDPAAYPSVTPERMGSVQVPLLALGETVNTTGFQPCAPAGDNFEQYVAHAVAPALAVEIVGADHMSFLDDPQCGLLCDACPDGPAAPAEVRALTRTAMVAFMDGQLAARPGAADWLQTWLTDRQTAGDVVLSGPGL